MGVGEGGFPQIFFAMKAVSLEGVKYDLVTKLHYLQEIKFICVRILYICCSKIFNIFQSIAKHMRKVNLHKIKNLPQDPVLWTLHAICLVQ